MTLIVHCLGPQLFLPWRSEATLAIWSERLAKGPYHKNTLPTVGLESVIYRWQTRAFYQLSYSVKNKSYYEVERLYRVARGAPCFASNKQLSNSVAVI